MPVYKLYYFDLRNFAEPARQMFALSGVEFEDIRLSFEQWGSLKAEMPFGQVPVLEVDGVKIPQSLAINRYLARKFGYAGKTPEEEALVDSFAELYIDFYSDASPFFYTKLGMRDLNLEEQKEKALIPARDKFLTFITKFLKKSKSGFLVDSGLTYADLFIADSMTSYVAMFPDFLANYPEVATYVEKVNNVPAIKAHIAKRKVTVI